MRGIHKPLQIIKNSLSYIVYLHKTFLLSKLKEENILQVELQMVGVRHVDNTKFIIM